MNRRHGIVLLLTLALLGLIAWLALGPRRPQLRGVGEIELFQVTVGTTHNGHWGSPIRARLRNLMPSAIQRRIDLPIAATFKTPTNTLMVWFKIMTPAERGACGVNLGSRYECTLVDAQGKDVAADDLNTVVSPQLYGDRRKLCYATFPIVRGNVRVRVQQRVEDKSGCITFTRPRPPGAGLSGARLSPEAVEFKLSL